MTKTPTVLDALNRTSQKQKKEKNDEMRKKKEGFFLVKHSKWVMIVFANIVVFVFDALLVTTVYEKTHNVILSLLALLPSGIPLIMGELGWLYPLASAYQKTKALLIVGVSAFSALFTGALSVIAFLYPQTWNAWLAMALLAFCLLAVLLHAYQAALFFYKDPVTKREHDLQVTMSEQKFNSETVEETRSILTTVRSALEEENKLRQEFGNAAVDRALNMILDIEEKTGIDINKDGIIGRKQANTYAHDVPQVLEETDPTNPPRR